MLSFRWNTLMAIAEATLFHCGLREVTSTWPGPLGI